MLDKLPLDISPDIFALLLVLSMVATGYLLSLLMDKLTSWLAVLINIGGESI